MALPLLQIDAFTATPFAGNPAAVCLLATPRDTAWMQQVAREMNPSETAFLLARDDGYQLRWFTPTVEVNLCGHATLASAHALWELGVLTPEAPARFHTRSGPLTATRHGAWIELDFPALPPAPVEAPPNLAPALGATPRYVGLNGEYYLVELADEATVRALRPDLALLRTLDRRRVIVTSAASTPGFDFVSRFFAPAQGIDEDPVTGSAHYSLGPYWADKLGRATLTAYQASARGGVIEVAVRGDRVALRGQAVTVLRGELVAD